MQITKGIRVVSSYKGRHAELYDIFYSDKPYDSECSFVHQQLKELGGDKTRRLLELACGTGTHALLFEKLGYELVATDYSEDMLSVARAKASSVQSSIQFVFQDMRSLNLGIEPFDAAICLFDSIGYVQTNESVCQVFDGVHRHLKDDGLFVFDFWHAGAMLRHYDPLRVRRWKLSDREILRISESKLECGKQVCHVSYDIYEFRTDGTYSNVKETQTNRYFLIQEMRMLLETNGFAPLKFFSGYTQEEKIDEGTWHVLAAARKKRRKNTG